MEIADLKTLISVVEYNSIKRAAEELHRAPSGITTRIMQLEAELGVQLFLREKKRLFVTPQGRELCAYARRIMELLEEAEARLKGREPGGSFRIGAMESTIAARLPEPLAKLHAQFAEIQIEVTAGTSRSLFNMLMENRLDVVFIADRPHDESVESCPIFTEELVFVAPGGSASIDEPSDLAGRTLLTFKDGCTYRKRLLSWFGAYSLEPERIAELTSYHAIMGGAAAGMGVGIVPKSVVELFPKKSRVTTHIFPSPLAIAETELVWRKGMKTANIEVLLEQLT